MARLGADLESMAQLVSTLNQRADELGSLITGVTNQVQSTDWEGTDASNFKTSAWPQSATQLRNVQTMLTETANRIRQQAEAQRATSNA
jgi:uncharacterized protein YukE